MRSVELFAGCGGLALGLARAGFKHELIIERDSDSVMTLRENKRLKTPHFRDWTIEDADTREINFSRYMGVDLVSGGPPCQPFSIGGKHLGLKDPRNMWPEAIRAVREIRPRAFVFENVRGLLRPDFSDYLAYITLQLTFPDVERRYAEKWKTHLKRLRQHRKSKRDRIGDYRVLVTAINAADYGAPQKRHRAIIVGAKSTLGDNWSLPKPTHSQHSLVWSKYIGLDYWDRHAVRKVREPASESESRILSKLLEAETAPKECPWATVRDAIDDLPPARKKPKLPGHWQHEGARTYKNHTGSSLDEPAKALKAGDHGVPGGENMVANRWGNVRYFTVREMARLQGLPDDFVISGSWKAATRQLGNAVPTSVGESIGEQVFSLLAGDPR